MPADPNPYDSIVSAATAPKPSSYDDIIERHATANGIDSNLVRAVMGQESSGNRTAVSPKGARGLMQLMPATAARFGVTNPNDPEQNIAGGTKYLKYLSDRYNGDTDKILAGYNAGEGNVDKYGGIPPFKETQNYVPSVKARYAKLSGQQKPVTNPYDSIVQAATAPDPQAPAIKAAEADVESKRQVQANVETRKQAATPNPYDSIVAAATPQASGRGAGMARAQGTVVPLRRRVQAQQGWGGGGTIGQGVPTVSVNAMGGLQTNGVGGLRQIDDPETSRIIRAQRQVTAEQTPAERTMQRAPGTADARLFDPHLSENEEVLRRVAAEKDQQDQLAKQTEWEQENKAEIDRHVADYRKQIQDSGFTKWLTETQAKGASSLMEFGAGGADVVGATRAANAMRVRAVAAAQAAQEEGAGRAEASKFAQDIIGGFAGSAPELLLMQAGVPPIATFAAGGGLRAKGMGRPVAPAVTQGALTGAAFEIPEAGAPGVRGTLTRAGKVGAATTGVDLATGAPVGQALKSGVVNAAMVAGPGLANEPNVRAAERARQIESQTRSDTTVPDINAQLAAREAAVKPVTDAQGNVLLNADEVAQNPNAKPKIRLAGRGANETLKQPLPLQKSSDRVMVFDPQPLRDAVRSKPFQEQGLSGLPVESQRLVMSSVLAAIHQPEIREQIVKFIPIDVVDNLSRVQSASDVLLHDPDVLSNTPPVTKTDRTITLPIDTANALARVIANSSAEDSGISIGAGDRAPQQRSAARTGNIDSFSESAPETLTARGTVKPLRVADRPAVPIESGGTDEAINQQGSIIAESPRSRHAQLQPRDDSGKFDQETPAQAEARRQQVAAASPSTEFTQYRDSTIQRAWPIVRRTFPKAENLTSQMGNDLSFTHNGIEYDFDNADMGEPLSGSFTAKKGDLRVDGQWKTDGENKWIQLRDQNRSDLAPAENLIDAKAAIEDYFKNPPRRGELRVTANIEGRQYYETPEGERLVSSGSAPQPDLSTQAQPALPDTANVTPQGAAGVASPATEDQVRAAQSPSGPETHPTVRRFLSSDYKTKILAAIGSDAEPLNPTELGGIKSSSVSFRKPDGSIVKVEDAAFSDSKPTYGNKRDGFVVTRSAPETKAVPAAAGAVPETVSADEIATERTTRLVEAQQRARPVPEGKPNEVSSSKTVTRSQTATSGPKRIEAIGQNLQPNAGNESTVGPNAIRAELKKPSEGGTGATRELSFPKTLESTGRETGNARVYQEFTDKESQDRADARIAKDREAARNYVLRTNDAPETSAGKERIATGLKLADQLASEAERSKDPIDAATKHGQAIELYDKLSTDLLEAGQTVQAASQARKYSPAGAPLEVVRIAKRNGHTPKATDIATVREMAKRQDDLETRLADVQKQIETMQANGKKTVTPRAKVETLTDRLARMESDARARLDARAKLAQSQTVGSRGQRGAGINPVDVAASIADWTTIGAAKIARGGLNFAAWSKEMVGEFGEAIKPHLNKIFLAAHKLAGEQRTALKEESTQRTATKASMSLDDFKQQRYELQTQKRQARLDMDRKFNELDRRAQRGPIKKVGDAVGSVLTNSLLSYHGLLNILSTMTAKEAINTALRVPEAGLDLAERGIARTFGKQIPRASAGLSPRQVGRAVKTTVTEGPGNIARAFLGRPSEVMPNVHEGATDSAKLNLVLDFMSRHYAAKEALVRTPTYNFERSNQASIMAHNDVTDGIIKRSQLNQRIDDYLNGRASLDGPLNKKYAASLADQAADYEIKSRNPTTSGIVTPSAKAARVKEMLANPTQLIDSQALQYADKESYANPLGPRMQKIQAALNAGGPIPKALIQPFFKRPVNAFNDLLYSYTGAKALKEGGQAALNTLRGQEWTPAERQSFNRAVARGGTVYGLAALGYALAGRGLITSGNDKQHPGCLVVGNSYWNIGNKPVIGWAIVAGATARIDGMNAVPKAVGRMVLDHPLLKGLKNVTDAAEEGYQAAQGNTAKIGKAAAGFASKTLSRAIPTPIAATAETMDTQTRDTSGLTGPLKARIPFVRQQLPPTGPKERGSAFDPFLVQPIRLKPRGAALKF